MSILALYRFAAKACVRWEVHMTFHFILPAVLRLKRGVTADGI